MTRRSSCWSNGCPAGHRRRPTIWGKPSSRVWVIKSICSTEREITGRSNPSRPLSHRAKQALPRSTPTGRSHPVDRFVLRSIARAKLTPSRQADWRTLARRLYFDLTGLPPTLNQIESFATEAAADPEMAIASLVDRLIESPEYGQHIGRLWLDVVRYADTDAAYRPDTKTPHYYPFAFTYRDYVIGAFNADKPFDQFLKEQLAADLMGHDPRGPEGGGPEGGAPNGGGPDGGGPNGSGPNGSGPFGGAPEGSAPDTGDPETAALGFLAAGPYANRAREEALDDWIDVTTRGLMGITVACARCHDHKFEPVPTTDYYALRGVFAAVTRVHPLDEKRQPELACYQPTASERAAYEKQRAAIDAKIEAATGKKARNNNRSIAEKIRETELAQLLSFHPGARLAPCSSSNGDGHRLRSCSFAGMRPREANRSSGGSCG